LNPGDVSTLLWLVGAVVVALIVARGLFVLAMVFVTRAAKAEIAQRPTFGREAAILAWAGARGPISGLAAFSLPALTLAGTDFPYRDLVLATTFLVVVVTLILAETLGPVARLLKIPKDDDTLEIARVDGALARAALARLDAAVEEMAADGDPLSPDAVESLRGGLTRRIDRSVVIQGATEDHS
jgi:monovalent cation/hydrogen antiporter